jgi:hypothetical protein
MNGRNHESSPAETKSETPQAPRQGKKALEISLTGEMLEEANSKVALNVMGRFAARILKA